MKNKEEKLEKSNKEFWTMVGGLVVSLIIFSLSMLDGSPRDLISVVLGALVIIFAVALIKVSREKGK